METHLLVNLNLHRYFHKKKSSPIFDVEEKEYDYTAGVISCSFDENNNSVNLNCITKKGCKVPVKIQILSEDIFRIRTSTGASIEDRDTEMVVGKYQNGSAVSIEEKEGQIIAERERLVIKVSKKP